MNDTARMTEPRSELVELTADIVSAYVSKNTVVPADLAKLIDDTFGSLAQVSAKAKEPKKEELIPALSIKRSVTPEAIVCLECGKKYKSLKRHIRTAHALNPDEYREKWSLPHDYPMVAPNYSSDRSKMAKRMGLGRKPKAANGSGS